MRIAVVGAGYVGLVTGTCLAETGNEVACVDIDEEKIARLARCDVPFYEPNLQELVTRNVAERRLVFSTRLDEAVRKALVVFIVVGTPPRTDGGADLAAVLDTADGIGRALDGYKVVVIKSTVPVGTASLVERAISRRTDCEFDVAANPEFLKEGKAVLDFMNPDRIVIGAESARASEILRGLYEPFVRTENPIVVMDIRSAEMTKYAANALLATRISFMNEIAGLCEKVGADVESVRKGIGADKRIGYPFLFPGIGYGGSCLPKDVKALVRLGQEHGFEMRIPAAVDEVNAAQGERFFEKINGHFGEHLAGKRIAVWGLSFKPGTDDVREAPAVTLITRLEERGARVFAHDPKANDAVHAVLGEKATYYADAYDALQGADALALVTEWAEFRSPDLGRMKALMKTPVIFDGRDIYDPAKLRTAGFTYYGVGRP